MEREDVKGNCILLPHLCVSEIIRDNNLIEMLEARSDSTKDWNKEDYEFIKSLASKGAIEGYYICILVFFF